MAVLQVERNDQAYMGMNLYSKYAIHVLHNYNVARFCEYLRKITLVLLDVRGYLSCYTSRPWRLGPVLWRRLCGSEFPDQRGQVKY